MTGASTGGPEPPTNEIAGYGAIQIAIANDPKRVIDLGTETSAVALKANPENDGIIVVGFDDNVTTSTGFILEAGQGLSIDLDANQAPIYVAGDTPGDDVRWIATG